MEDKFDLAIIGGGPGGYVAAIRAAQLGLKVACIDKRGAFGGTCLNVGCIPSKALLHASEMFHAAGHDLAAMGIDAKPKLDVTRMMAHKTNKVGELTKGIEFLFKKNNIQAIKAAARFVDASSLELTDDAGKSWTIKANNIVVATGSAPTALPGVEFDEEVILSSTGALSLPKVPKKLVVVGAGYIGLELGSVWQRLGSEVTVVEFLERVTPGMDGEISRQFEKILSKQGMIFRMKTKVMSITRKGKKASVVVEPRDGGTPETIDADAVLVSIGRNPYTSGLGLEEVGVAMDEKGRVKTDGHFSTNVPGIYAIGDVIDGPMLAHKAEEEGVALAEMLSGQSGHVNYDVIPGVVYTSPEVATVGKTEEQLKDAGISYKVGKFPFAANSLAKINHGGEGFVKLLADAQTDKILGVHMMGPDVGNMIGELALAMEFGASSEDVARTCHAHPTLTEAIKEAALAVDGRALHI